MKLPVCAALTLLLLATTPTAAAEFNVSDAAGLTAALQAALANDEDNVILLAAGRYDGNFEYRTNDPRSLTIRGADGTTREEVILDGGGAGRVLAIAGFTRESASFQIEVRGLTLEDGDTTSDASPRGAGLSISVARSTARIVDCVIRYCRAEQDGGGIYVNNCTDLQIERCFVHDNTVAERMREPGRGGGIMLSAHTGTYAVVGCVVAQNSAETEGGGLWVGFQNSGTRNIINNTLSGNSAPTGAGMYFYAAQTANVMNNFVGGPIVFRDGYVTNRVGYHNSVEKVIGDWTEEEGNGWIDPGFENPGELDFHLHGLSKLKDQGRNDVPGQIAVDHEGNPRISDGDGDGEPVVDIGAFEVYRDISVTIGSEIVVAGTGFGEKKPKLYLLYEKKPGKMKPAKLKVLEYTDGRLEALFKKPVPAGTYDLFCQPKVKGAPPISLGSIRVMAPQISEPFPYSSVPGTLITLEGDWLGAKKPKVYLKDPGSFLRRKVKVKTLEFEPTGNFGRVEFVLPKVPPGKYVLQFENKIGAVESSIVVVD